MKLSNSLVVLSASSVAVTGWISLMFSIPASASLALGTVIFSSLLSLATFASLSPNEAREHHIFVKNAILICVVPGMVPVLLIAGLSGCALISAAIAAPLSLLGASIVLTTSLRRHWLS